MILKTFDDSTLKLIDYSVYLHSTTAYFTTTKGGVSTGDYATLNLSKASGDDHDNVDKNMQILMSKLPQKSRHLYSKQIHGTDIFVDDGKVNGLVGAYDGIISHKSDVILSTYHADCVPVYASVENSPYFGVAHSGWKGTYGEIAKRLVQKLSNLSGRPPSDIKIVIGAAIDGQNYEISQDLAEDFATKFGKKIIDRRSGRFYLDLKHSIKISLLTAGVTVDNIFTDKTSTYDESDLLFSYRRQGVKSGRMMTIVWHA